MKNNIILVSPLPPPEGGMAIWTVKYLEFCNEKGINVDVVNIALKGRRKEKINYKTTFGDEWKRTTEIWKTLRSLVKQKKHCLIHYNSPCSNLGIIRDYFMIKMASTYNIPIVFECHCSLASQIATAYKKYMFRKIVAHTQLVLTLNEESLSIAKSLTNLRVEILPNFIEDDYCKCVNRQINSKIQNILYVGHIQKTKGSEELINVARIRNDLHFKLIGPVDDEIGKINVPSNVTLTGNIVADEVRNYLFNADVFLFPSYSEGFSMSVLEAMAMGVPIIATDVGANKEMIENRGGIIIPAKDEQEILNSLRLIESPVLRKEMSDWNIAKVRNYYTKDKVMDCLIEKYKSILL